MPTATAMPLPSGAGSAVSSPVLMCGLARHGAPAWWRAICAPTSTSMTVPAAPASIAFSSAATPAGSSVPSMCGAGRPTHMTRSIPAARSVFPGFIDQASAHFHGNVGQVFGEVGYGMALGQVATRAAGGPGLRAMCAMTRSRKAGGLAGAVGDQHQSEHQLLHPRSARRNSSASRQRHGADPARFAAMAICLRRCDAGHRARIPEHRHIVHRRRHSDCAQHARLSKAALTGASARRPSLARTTRANSPPTPKATPSRVR